MLKKFMFFASALALLNACVGPSPISKLDPQTKNFTWNYGQKYIDKTRDSIRFSIAFNKNIGNDLVFDIEVTNYTTDSILVSPETYFYKAMNEYGTMLGRYVYAVNPEKMLLELDKQLAREEAHQANQAIVDLVSTTTEAAATVASLDESPHKKQALYNEITYNRHQREMNELNSEQRVRSLNAERDFWEDKVLRNTELAPGYSIKGKVYFERKVGAASYEFKFPIDDQVFKINYKQILHKP